MFLVTVQLMLSHGSKKAMVDVLVPVSEAVTFWEVSERVKKGQLKFLDSPNTKKCLGFHYEWTKEGYDLWLDYLTFSEDGKEETVPITFIPDMMPYLSGINITQVAEVTEEIFEEVFFLKNFE